MALTLLGGYIKIWPAQDKVRYVNISELADLIREPYGHRIELLTIQAKLRVNIVYFFHHNCDCVQNVSSEIMFPESKNIHSQIVYFIMYESFGIPSYHS